MALSPSSVSRFPCIRSREESCEMSWGELGVDVGIEYRKFDDVASEAIKYYVYALRDPRDGSVFYVGKGRRNRWFDHIKDSVKDADRSSLKLERIRQIESAGLRVDVFIVRHGISSEKVAFEIEAAVIHAYRLLERSSGERLVDLTNIAEAHHPERGLAHIDIVQSLFNAPKAPEITVPAALFRIPRLWYPEMTSADLRDATTGWWSERTVKKRKHVARYAFSVSRGVIRGVYQINESDWRQRVKGDRDWEHDVGKRPRWGFPDCKDAPEMSHFLNTSVKHLFKKGDQNPIKFVNCG